MALEIDFGVLEMDFEVDHGQRGLRCSRPAKRRRGSSLGLTDYDFFFL